MSEGSRHQYGLTVSALFWGGGISFTIMAFLIELITDDKIHYPMIDNIPIFWNYQNWLLQGLLPLGLFIVLSIGMISVPSSRISEVSPMARCAYSCMLVGFYNLCGAIVLLLLPFYTIGAVAVAIISCVIIVLYSVLYGRFEE